MKFNKLFILLLMFTLLFSFGGNVLADTIEATYSDIKLFLNGTQIEEDILIINGSSYLPLRAISEALGLKIDWNGEEKAIYLSQEASTAEGDSQLINEFGILDKLEQENTELKQKIKDLEGELASYKNEDVDSQDKGEVVYAGVGLEPFNFQSGDDDNGVMIIYEGATVWDNSRYSSEGWSLEDNLGNEYNNFIFMHLNNKEGFVDNPYRWMYIEFPTMNKYKQFKAKLVLDSSSKNTKAKINLTIYADNKNIYEKEIKAGEFPSEINLDIENVEKLRIKMTSTGSSNSEERIGLIDARFIK